MRRLPRSRACTVEIRTAETILDRFLEQARVRVVPITAEMGRRALSASNGTAKDGIPPHRTWVTA
jgi:uncharacterized protein with PIN domain